MSDLTCIGIVGNSDDDDDDDDLGLGEFWSRKERNDKKGGSRRELNPEHLIINALEDIRHKVFTDSISR